MGAATALYSATCRILGQYGNGKLYSVNLNAIVGLSGWLPCSRTLKSRMERSHESARHAASLPILLCHGLGDDVVAYRHGERSAQILNSVGFRDLTIRSYNGKHLPTVEFVYEKRIVGCADGEGEDEHDVLWFWLEKDKQHKCPVCSHYFIVTVVGAEGPGGDGDNHHHLSSLLVPCGKKFD